MQILNRIDLINPFSSQCFHLISLKTSENLEYSVFRRIQSKYLKEMGPWAATLMY